MSDGGDASESAPHLVDDFFSTIEEAGLGDLAEEVGIRLGPRGNADADDLISSSQPMQVRRRGSGREARRGHTMPPRPARLPHALAPPLAMIRVGGCFARP
jgi:hypothetical protein